ncbi:tRNA adenosine(34) deaminase TadA [Candidatus Magnetomonas plexicatena]|uniref:tRNA adenosine(34) deaminase TadA n=1 Tax=Candidatus Magnetomonas plexicatena TaxID=2552947 RepID=UPI001102FB71|nr:nucleoside deaminase [Nitrospirales bacterium LBB_01]QWR76933.1 nucleoside deaminase [Nitrospirales bacterium LBB_01]
MSGGVLCTDDECYMGEALKEASLALESGDVPVGAVIVSSNGTIISRAHNIKEQLGDPTAHAETLAIREACRITGDWRLKGLTLYVTKEPCVMCAGAILNSRISRLVYGSVDTKAGAVNSLYNLLNDVRLNHRVIVTSGILQRECTILLKEFFELLRRGCRAV